MLDFQLVRIAQPGLHHRRLALTLVIFLYGRHQIMRLLPGEAGRPGGLAVAVFPMTFRTGLGEHLALLIGR